MELIELVRKCLGEKGGPDICTYSTIHTLIYLTKDNDSWEACIWIIWNSWMEDEDAYSYTYLKLVTFLKKKQHC